MITVDANEAHEVAHGYDHCSSSDNTPAVHSQSNFDITCTGVDRIEAADILRKVLPSGCET